MSQVPLRYRWILLISLALNLALGVHLLLHRPRDPGFRFSIPPPQLLARDLSAEGKAVLETAFQRHRDAIRPEIGRIAQSREALHELMRAPDSTREQLLASFAQLRTHEQASAAAVQAMLVEIILGLSPEDRSRLAKTLEQLPGPHGRHGRRRDGDHRHDRTETTAPSAEETVPAPEAVPAAPPQP